MRKTKIVCTIGPSSRSEQKLTNLIESGMDIVRLNFSHGKKKEHAEVINRVKSISKDIAVMMDTQGPEIRLREVEEDTFLKQGNEVKLTSLEKLGNSQKLSVDQQNLMRYLEPDDKVLIDDGKIELIVESVNENQAICRVVFGGEVSSKKSVNVPGKNLGIKAPTKKDKKDIKFGAKHGFDYVSVSFVKTAEEVLEIKKLVEGENSDMGVIAKIEHKKGVENVEDILRVADGIMVARGDLGVEVPPAKVPMLQKNIIEKCNKRGKPVITATQMLLSMTHNPRATRAEVSDVANAAMDGTDAVMLSEETAIGDYPTKTVKFMSEALNEVEKSLKSNEIGIDDSRGNIASIVSKGVCNATEKLENSYIVALTSSGYTARKIAKHRPDSDILVFTDSKHIKRKLNIVWGVKSFYLDLDESRETVSSTAAKLLLEKDIVKRKDNLILTAGFPTPEPGNTNMMEIRKVKSLVKKQVRKS